MDKEQRLQLIKKMARKVNLQSKNKDIVEFAQNKRFRRKTTTEVVLPELDEYVEVDTDGDV